MNASHAYVIVDLAYGDCGKGTITDFLSRQCGAHTVIRFNGGPQAAHHVVTSDGRQHAFSQFGSGTLVPGVRTLLSRFMLIEPYALLNEANHLTDLGVYNPLDRLDIDARCPVITPAHQAANRLREIARGDRAHGTCGLGIGETTQDLVEFPDLMIYANELANRGAMARKLRAICDIKTHQLRDLLAMVASDPRAQFNTSTLLDPSWIAAAVDNYAELARHAHIIGAEASSKIIRAPGTVIFEGAQGVLLDQTFGFHPHTTWSDTTFANAQALLDEAGHCGPRTRIGVLRTYFTRHGAGPFVTEDSSLRTLLPEPHNTDAGWQGRFRIGVFDAVAARYALAVCGGVDGLAVTHLDRLGALPQDICSEYQDHSPPPTGETPFAPDGFIRRGSLITYIDPKRQSGPASSERLTARLANCTPVRKPIPTDNDAAFLDALQAELHAPVCIVSTGNTAESKALLMPRLFCQE